MGKHTIQELQMFQALPLNVKIQMTKNRIRGWIDEFGVDGVYVSFSGGKDSTVLLDIVRQDYPDVVAVFVDVPTQYPELREFAQSYDNVEIIKPTMSFAQVCEQYGFPLLSKEVANNVCGARKYIKELDRRENARQNPNRQTDRQTDRFHIPTTTEEYAELASMLNEDLGKTKGSPQRLAKLLGMWQKTNKASIPNKTDRSNFAMDKYKFMLDAPFDIDDSCCRIMKKNPVHDYEKKTGRKPFIATMASESTLRTQKWLQQGCNSFEGKHQASKPMSFWTEQDVLLYIKMNNLPICSVYGDIVEDWDETDDIEGQMTISDLEGWGDMELFDAKRPPLKTTGCNRTGCVLCGFGCHLEDRFNLLRETHPGFYKLLDVMKNNGVTYREAIEWINEHGNLDIKL